MGYPPNFDRGIDDNYLLDLELRGAVSGEELHYLIRNIRNLQRELAEEQEALLDAKRQLREQFA